MGATTKKRALRFHAGEVGFVFYEERDRPVMQLGRIVPAEELTYAFGSIGDAAAWLIQQFGSEADTRSVTTRQPLAG